MATEAQIEIPRTGSVRGPMRLIGGGLAALLGILVATYALGALLVPAVRSVVVEWFILRRRTGLAA